VGGTVSHNSYLFYIGFPFALTPGITMPTGEAVSRGQQSMQVHVLQGVIHGCEFDGGDAPQFDILLGMDVISTGSLVVGNGSFGFSF
jgi:hypothetical protein